jgi:prepilin-type N-terminal cleavage/methylation domain-containing protein
LGNLARIWNTPSERRCETRSREALKSMRRFSRRSGFTLIEVVIVVMILVIILEISVPSFLRARQTAHRNTCVGTLKQIDQAKEEWAMDNGAPQGAAVLMSDIGGVYIRSPATGPICPGGGSYTVNPVGTDPTCNLSPAPTLHVLPY